MKISDPDEDLLCDELEMIVAELPLTAARVLELGCGKAKKTRAIAQSGKVASILALDVDAIQHARNRQITDLPNVRFCQGAAEAIPADDSSFDIVMMFKSLHHVPINKMDLALSEILRLFHDEKQVREAAFAAIQRSVGDARFTLVRQCFFSSPSHFESFEHFEKRIIQVTHTNHQLSPEQ